jgi:hypothetical protein
MAEYKEPYKNLDTTLKALRQQVIDSLNYCSEQNFYYDSPRQMYYNLLQKVKYKNDPPGTELIQTVPTLLDKNFYGYSGQGDCDCFTVLTLSVGAINNWKQRVVLCGRKKNNAVHIFSQVYWNGDWHTVDLTARMYNTHKKYNFYQFLPV